MKHIIIIVVLMTDACHEVDRSGCDKGPKIIHACPVKVWKGSLPELKYDNCKIKLTNCIGCESYIEFPDQITDTTVKLTFTELERYEECRSTK